VTKLTSSKEQHVALFDGEAALALGPLDIGKANAVAALDHLDTPQSGGIDQHAARQDAELCSRDVVTQRPLAAVHQH
jgi:hypothetical protein